MEPLHLFENIQDEDHRRPDILISNPYGGGPQIILDVAVTGVTGQSRRSDLHADQPLENISNHFFRWTMGDSHNLLV